MEDDPSRDGSDRRDGYLSASQMTGERSISIAVGNAPISIAVGNAPGWIAPPLSQVETAHSN